MEYKYQIGEIVYDRHVACVITAHGVYQDGDVAVPYYQATSVTVPLGTRNLPLTDDRIHRDNSMKTWYREGLLSGVDEYYEDQIKRFDDRKQLLEQDIQVVEEKIKRFKDLLNPGNDSPSGYVIRTHRGNGEFVGYTSDYAVSRGASKNYSQRKRYPDLSYAADHAAQYNEINSKVRCGDGYYYAVVIPDGTEEECLKAAPVWKEDQ